VAFGAVLALFLIAFRRARALIVAGIPLIVGIVWTLGIATALIGRIDALTAASVPILCGLAIDFIIHLYNRYLEEIHKGRETLEAFIVAHSETGRGILAAAATTTWAFLALGLGTLPGPRNLGGICAIGMPVCLVASLLLVPALTAVTTGLRRAPDRPRRLAGFGLEPLLRKVLRYPRAVLAIGAVCTALLSVSAMRSELRDGIGNPPTMPSKQLLNDISRRVGARVEVIATLVRGDSWSAGLEAAAKVERELRRLTEDEGPLAWVVGPSQLLPPPTRQRAVLERLRRLRELEMIEPERVEHDLLAAMDRHGFRVDRHARDMASRVSALLSRERPLSLAEAKRSPIGDLLKEMLIEHDDGTVTAIVTTYARPGVDSSRMIESLEAGIERTGVAAELVGSRILSQQLKPIAYRDAKLAGSIAALGVVAILVLTFRSVLLAVVTFVPVLAGGVAAIGLMPLFSYEFDVVSISMVPVILGIGIDDGIHIVHRFRGSPHEDLVQQFRHTGRGVVITSLTTIVGFGSMMFADSPGMASAGLVVVFGVGATLVTAVTIVPALLKLTRRLPAI
jgi:predicted RND superfamily exporter protein